MNTNNTSAETSQRRHLYLPTRVSSTTTTTNLHWESQPILTWMSSLVTPEEGTAFPTPVFVPKQQAERYQRLVEHCHIRSNHATFWNDYQTIQSLHHFLMNKITSQWPVTCPEYTLALERLYHETSDRLEALFLSLPAMESSAKPDMTQFMTAWLRDNWINPYPDDIVLNEMAARCGTTPTVIGNWLINARTRKWRPAIVKAMRLSRPAKYLLEDSLCFFDGRPVRGLSSLEQDADGAVVLMHKPSLIADEDDWNPDNVNADHNSLKWMEQETVVRSSKRPRS